MDGLRYGIFHELEVRGRAQEVEAFDHVLDQVEHANRLACGSSWCEKHHFTRRHRLACDRAEVAAATAGTEG